jgi:hypothetical protein
VWKLQQRSLQPNKEKSLIRGVDHDDEHNAYYKSIVTLKDLHPAGYVTNLRGKFFISCLRVEAYTGGSTAIGPRGRSFGLKFWAERRKFLLP